MEYRDCVINLLDTPGHQDFSEDTYRVLTAVDAALMVIDAANGVEPQTRRLLQVCRARNTPILTFVNKMDREVQEPLGADGRDRARARHERRAVHLAGRHGQALPRRDGPARASRCASSRRARTASSADDEMLARPRQPGVRRALRRRVRARRSTTSSCCATPRRRSTRRSSSPAGRRRCSSARRSTTSACARCSTRWSTWRRRRARSAAMQREVQPDEPKFTGVVFKIQANMDPAHRDRIAFVRVASGHFERGMRLKVARSGKELRPNTVVSFLSQRRELLDEAYRRRHHRHPEPRRAAARRHAHRRRDAAVHRAAVLRAGDVPHASRSPIRCAPSSCAPG